MTQHLKPCEPNDELRCKGVGSGAEGQCRYLSYKGLIREGIIEETSYNGIDLCPKHGGRSEKAAENRQFQQYLLAKYQAQLDGFAQSEKIKDLRSEVGLLRLLVQNILDRVQKPDDLLLFTPKIADLVQRVEKTVTSLDRLELRMGELLSKGALMTFVVELTDVIRTHIEDADILEAISKEILSAVDRLQTSKVVK